MTDHPATAQVEEEEGAFRSSAPVSDEGPPPTGAPVQVGGVGWLRWFWRQLTSMRTALLLLLLLALASIPGSILPQRGTAPLKVNEYLATHETLGRILDRFGLFDVFAAPWFAAVYLLLFVSLTGCVLPRSMQHLRASRARPPAAPRNLSRLPQHRSFTIDASGGEVVAAAEKYLQSKRWRVDVEPGEGRSVSAEKGYLRETGNLLFHVALLLLLLAVGLGNLFGFKGQVIVREGSGFSNSLTQYDTFSAGRLVDAGSLPPFSLRLDDFRASYDREGTQVGSPREFAATATVVDEPGGAPRTVDIAVNEPLVTNGTKVFLLGHGYAPKFTITDKSGQVVFDDAVVFLPQDGNFTSTGVIKVPDAIPQLGFQGIFTPTAGLDATRGPHSTFPAADDPAVFLAAFKGDLGLDSGAPQSVYSLDTTQMRRIGIKGLRPGESWALPEGLGTVKFTGYVEYGSFVVARDPGKEAALAAMLVAIAGLVASLFVRRRRLWVRVSPSSDGRTLVEVAGLARTESPGLATEVDDLTARLADAGTGRRDTVSTGSDRSTPSPGPQPGPPPGEG